MSRNVEIKARLRDRNKVLQDIKRLTDDEGAIIRQTDTFYDVPNGRLKFRQIEGVCSELIYYDRPNLEGPKLSSYEKYESPDRSNLASVLSRALGVKGIVKKVRHLYMVDQTRVHIDDVEELGHFVELEVVLKPDQTVEEGQKIAEDIMSKLEIEKDDLIPVAYLDLLQKQ